MRTAVSIGVMVALNLFLASCDEGKGRLGDGITPIISTVPQTPFTVTSSSELIGGPMAIGRVGDILLQNDQIRVIIQKPGKNAGLGSFGGTIIDADLVGGSGDQFGEIFPLVNVEWTVNYYFYEVISDGAKGSPKILRAYGRIDVYDYLDLDFITEAAEGIAGQQLSFSNRFDDRRDPFDIYNDLKGLDPEVVTDYILEPGKRYVRIETTFKNRGNQEVRMPIGEFVNGSGQVSLLIPGLGFSPDLAKQIAAHTPAVIYEGFEGVPVSYGYFYNPWQFRHEKDGAPRQTTSVSFAGLTGVILGETFLKILPLGVATPPDIKFSIPPKESKTITRYFVVGDGSAGSVLEVGLEALGVPMREFSGMVLDGNEKPIAGARVLVKNQGSGTVATYRTDSDGRFLARLPMNPDPISKTFGKGIYIAEVDMPGFHANGTTSSGTCSPDRIDLTSGSGGLVQCTLGESGTIALPSPVIDASTGQAIAARLTIVGTDPSPNETSDLLKKPYGIAEVKFIAVNGTMGLSGKQELNLEPGVYRLVFSHGPEYGVEERVVEVVAGEKLSLKPVTISRVVETPGYVSSDFHIHAINSPDSSVHVEGRVLSASAEGLDVLQSSDHDFLTNYAPVAHELMDRGVIPHGSIQTSVGDEITPNQFGHVHAFPLEHDSDDVAGGAIDWSHSDLDEISTAPDYSMGLVEIIAAARADPGEEVIQMNHIADNLTSLLAAAGWVTSPFYLEGFGVALLSSYADPVERRLAVEGLSANFPKPYGTSHLVSTDINAVELTIGPHLHAMDGFLRSALPTWFNFLNMGLLLTATGNSDSHTEISTPLGIPRNYIASSIDPRDGRGGSFSEIDLEEYATNINAGRVIVSAGPFISVVARGANGTEAKVGDTVSGGDVELEIKVEAPSWAWFDTVELYANVEPIPVDDATGAPMMGTAADPAQFYNTYHVPKYTYQPTKRFRLADGTLEGWKEKEGKISSTITTRMTFKEDSWIVILVRGTQETEGYRSLFPMVPDVLKVGSKAPDSIDPADLTSFHQDDRVGAPAWALTNPIYVDVDGDGFQAKYIRDGRSPL